MDIRIIKHVGGTVKKTLDDNRIVLVTEEESKYENVKREKYFVYDLKSNKSVEIKPDIKKYNLIEVDDIGYKSPYVYFSELKDSKRKGYIAVNVYKYNCYDGASQVVYSFEEELDKFDGYMRMRVFALGDYYLFIQNEYLRNNLTENYEGYFDFELSMYSINEKKTYKVYDEKLNQCGIDTFIPISNNVCIIKTGYSLIQDERYKILTKDEAVLESVSFVNVGQMVSDIIIGQQNVVMDTIEHVFFTKTIPYVKVIGDYVVYSIVKVSDKLEEEIIFYNFVEKESLMCINSNTENDVRLVDTTIVGSKPYIIKESSKGYDFIDTQEPKNIVNLDAAYKLEKIVGNVIIATAQSKGLFGTMKEYIYAFSFPSMKLLHREKGLYDGCILAEDVLNILIK